MKKLMTRDQKERQIRKEAKATLILFAICFLWHVGFAYALTGTGIRVAGIPLWWIISTPGVAIVAIVGVIYLLKRVFVNFNLEDDKAERSGDEATSLSISNDAVNTISDDVIMEGGACDVK